MPSRPTLSCRLCGKPMWTGRGTLPQGQATCRACRVATGTSPGRPGKPRVECACAKCGATMLRKALDVERYARLFCSDACRLAYLNTDHPRQRKDRATRRAQDRERCARRRARKLAAIVEMVDPDVVLERDGWHCHICGRKIDRRLSGRDRMGPTIDHLVPLRDGGEHSYANVAAAHRSCNSRRGVSGAVQLALVG